MVSQAIKEVLQSLVDDDLVHGEKIGTSNYFWSFPSETTVKATAELDRVRARAEGLEKERAKLEEEAETRRAEAAGADAALAADLARELEELTAKEASLTSALTAHANADPERHAALTEATPVALSAANRWLDNVQCLKSWMRKRFQGNEAQVDDLFRENGLKDDDDYLEIATK